MQKIFGAIRRDRSRQKKKPPNRIQGLFAIYNHSGLSSSNHLSSGKTAAKELIAFLKSANSDPESRYPRVFKRSKICSKVIVFLSLLIKVYRNKQKKQNKSWWRVAADPAKNFLQKKKLSSAGQKQNARGVTASAAFPVPLRSDLLDLRIVGASLASSCTSEFVDRTRRSYPPESRLSRSPCSLLPLF